jgi:integrase
LSISLLINKGRQICQKAEQTKGLKSWTSGKRMEQRPLREYLTPQDVGRMVEIAKNHNERHALFLQTLYETGARISELVGQRKHDSKDGQDHPEYGLTPSAIDSENNTIRLACLKRKRREVRYVEVTPELVQALLSYCEREGIGPTDRIFPFTRVNGYYIVRKYAKLAGVQVAPNPIRQRGQHVHPHLFRHSNAIAIAKASKSVLGGLMEIQRRLGHKNLSTTFIYLRHFPREAEKEEVLKAIRGDTP